MSKTKVTGSGFFMIRVALFATGLAIDNGALGIIGLILVAFALLSARKARRQG